VASYDEDAASMAVEAAREALGALGAKSTPTISALLFASTSPPYAEKLNAATVQAATDLDPSILALDLSGSTRAGASALITAFDLATAGQNVLAVASDVVIGAPGGGRESGGGDAAAAFVVDAKGTGATLIGRASATEEVLDVWRTPSMQFASQWEERFGEAVFLPLLKDAFSRALDGAGLAAKDLAKVVVDGTNARVSRSFVGAAGLQPEQIADPLAATVGRCGAAHAGLCLAKVLDGASPGDKVAVVVAADGAEVLVLEVGKGIKAARPRRSVDRWVDSKHGGLAYPTYLKWREILPFEPPRRPDPARPAAPPMRRAERWKYAFVGSRCQVCGEANLPPQRVCVKCQAVDKMDSEPFAEAKGRIKTYTIDRLAYSLQPPVVAAVVDFEQGGRFPCQLTDVDPEKVNIGDDVEMTFRRIFTAGGVHNYFWKARPER
jgi:3-hydroxy-3-methylglutaryl CoA synthase/uncharacterized OB-fold protein